MGFAANGTKNPDAFVVSNVGPSSRTIHLDIKGNKAKTFAAFRPSEGDRRLNMPVERYNAVGKYRVENGKIVYECPAKVRDHVLCGVGVC